MMQLIASLLASVAMKIQKINNVRNKPVYLRMEYNNSGSPDPVGTDKKLGWSQNNVSIFSFQEFSTNLYTLSLNVSLQDASLNVAETKCPSGQFFNSNEML